MYRSGETAGLREFAIQVAHEAGALLLDRLGQVRDVRHKGVVDLVTEADLASERHIVGRLGERFPDHSVLAEESGLSSETGSARWIIDPLDGTTNFAHGFPIFAVSIAWQLDDVVRLGVVYVPALDELFVAERDKGATLNGRPIQVSRTNSLIEALLATGFLYDTGTRGRNLPHWANFTLASQGVRRTGAAAIDLCSVAAGRFDGFWEEGLSPWDTAAGSLMVHEAGGAVTAFGGAAYALGDRECLASNGLIHPEMMRILSAGQSSKT